MREGYRSETISFISDPRRFREIRQWFFSLVREEGLNENVSQEAAVALSEACGNIHRHAYEGRGDGRIDIEVTLDATDLHIKVQDYGSRFDLSGYDPPDLSRPAERGYGIYLMQALMDSVEYRPQKAGTTLVMVKSHTGEACRERAGGGES